MNIKEIMLKNEKFYSKYACFDKESIRLKEFIPDIRPNFSRDTDRIINSSSYNRYIGKTQVFTMPNNDNISRRSIHVQLVSKIARSIARALSLNEDLIEAISLGHDLGHVPFGHVGEKILNEISLEHKQGYFNHNVQSIRNLCILENNGNGLNLSIQVLDGILCHNGEIELKEYTPEKKDIKTFINDYKKCYIVNNYSETLKPMTLEGCVVRISDIIAYIGRDLEDAEKLGIIKKEDIPDEIVKVLGNTNKDIVNNIITDIIKNSLNKKYISISVNVFEAIKQLKNYNYKEIYNKIYNENQINEIKEMFNYIYTELLKSIKNDKNSKIYKDFYLKMNDEYIKKTSLERVVIDYIAGMTDEYFISTYKEYKNKTNEL